MKEATNIVDFPKSERAKWCGEPGSANINGKITRIICTKPAGHIGEHRWSWEPGPAEPLGSPPDSERVELCGASLAAEAFVCSFPKNHSGKHADNRYPDAVWCDKDSDDPTPTAFDKAWEQFVIGKVFWGSGKNDSSIVSRSRASYQAGWQARGEADLEAIRKKKKCLVIGKDPTMMTYGYDETEVDPTIRALDEPEQ